MKKLLSTLFFSVALAVALPLTSIAADPEPTIPATKVPAGQEARAAQLTLRLEEIRDMDRSEMNRTEKKELRKEVKEIKKEMKAMKGGVYLSVGAIIIILLVLILIL